MLRYVIAILLPPISALRHGGCGACLLNVLLCLIGYIPGIIHAVLIILKKENDEREARIMREIAQWESHQD